MIELHTAIEIELPVEEVFAFVSDPRNFPAWNSAVEAVRAIGAATSASRYLMERNLPGGRATNEIEIAGQADREFAFRTISGPTPFAYCIRFTPIEGATVMDLDVSASLAGAADLAGPLARAFVKRGVDHNLATLKAILERTRVSR